MKLKDDRRGFIVQSPGDVYAARVTPNAEPAPVLAFSAQVGLAQPAGGVTS
ncbi:MAG: hypothetical protein ACUVRU_01755 [Anaerolineae bacterium]